MYVFDGQVIQNFKDNISSMEAFDSITDDLRDRPQKGGTSALGQGFAKGIVFLMFL